MRQVVLDTETTGLEAHRGHRIIEVGCIELCERRRSRREFHRYINPQREVDRGAAEVHGLSNEFLADKPVFAEVAADLLAFIDGAELIIHNADFDVGFLNAELGLLGPGFGRIEDRCTVLDTLKLAREMFPGQRNSLDALCKRLDVDNSGRNFHGALLDADLLTEVYLALTAGQSQISFEVAAPESSSQDDGLQEQSIVFRPRRVLASEADLRHHEARLDALAKSMKGTPLWRSLEG